jgi:hypothetical protein
MQDMDGMLLRKLLAIRAGMLHNTLNRQWVEIMLQYVVDNNHAGDFALRPVWKTLKRPSYAEITKVLDTTFGYSVGINEEAKSLMRRMDFSAGPDEVQLTLANAKNLFIPSRHYETSEGTILSTAGELGLMPCPDWTSVALALDAERSAPLESDDRGTFNICLGSDTEERGGLAMFYRKNWHLYKRSVYRDSNWENGILWLFVKP